jgi:hypothetical protein
VLLQRPLILLAGVCVVAALAPSAGAGLVVKPLPCRFTITCDQVIDGTRSRGERPILAQILFRRVLMYDWIADLGTARHGATLRPHHQHHGLPHTSPWVL